MAFDDLLEFYLKMNIIVVGDVVSSIVSNDL